jgi:acetyl/propionyl-CoA carboxylase alpha subunit
MLRALREYVVGGIRTNCEFFKGVLEDEDFRAGRLTTAFLDGFFECHQKSEPDIETEAVAALVTVFASKDKTATSVKHDIATSKWSTEGRSAQLR